MRLANYEGTYLKKLGKPDGCATFVHHGLRRRQVWPLRYEDETGHVALLVALEVGEALIGIANTHLRWDPEDTPKEERIGRRQLLQLLEELKRFAPPCAGWIVCGDLNATPDSSLLMAARQSGFLDPYEGHGGETCNSNRRKKRIDYLLHSPSLCCKPRELPCIDDETPLPSESEPSDHLAIAGTFTFA
jgi:endonuclease/exonuclease/phosphatase family metal-dependent hydrolase